VSEPDALIEQPDATPTRKVAASALVGALFVVALGAAGALGVEVPGVDPSSLPVGEAFTLLVTAATGYLVRERAR
jgi:hypothetical protein